LDKLAKSEPALQIVDVRIPEEFNNQSKTSWRNVGNIKGAVNIPSSELENKWTSLDKNKPVLVYHFSGSDAYTAAKTLANHGFFPSICSCARDCSPFVGKRRILKERNI
jgi:rhodanese-related sulfurtransferase